MQIAWARWLVVGLALAACARVTSFVLAHAYSLYDDAYIYFTYAENAARGCGLVFRCDGSEPVEGFTGPLYMALLLGARALTPDLESCSQLFGLVGVAGAIALSQLSAAELLRRAGAGPLAVSAGAVAVSALLALDDHVALYGVIGLETGLAMLAVSYLQWASLGSRRAVTLAFCAAVLLRPECVLLSPLVLQQPDARRLRAWLLPGSVLLIAVATRLALYGQLLPNTYYAKAGGTPRHFLLGAAYCVEVLRCFPCVCAAPLALALPRLRPFSWPLLLSSGVWLAAFLVSGGDVFGYGRLFAPLVPSLTACAVAACSSALCSRFSDRASALATLGTGLGCALVLHTAHMIAPRHGFDNVLRWAALGKYLGAQHPGELIATVPVGAIAYYSGNPVLDLVGLTDRHVARAGRSVPPELLQRDWIGHERHATDWVLAQRPALIVLGAKYGSIPLRSLEPMRAGFYAEWLLLRLAKEGRIPYAAYTPEIAKGVYWHMLQRTERGPPLSEATR